MVVEERKETIRLQPQLSHSLTRRADIRDATRVWARERISRVIQQREKGWAGDALAALA